MAVAWYVHILGIRVQRMATVHRTEYEYNGKVGIVHGMYERMRVLYYGIIATPRSSYHTAVTSSHCDGKMSKSVRRFVFIFFLLRCCWCCCCHRKSLLNIYIFEVKEWCESMFVLPPIRSTSYNVSKFERHTAMIGTSYFFFLFAKLNHFAEEKKTEAEKMDMGRFELKRKLLSNLFAARRKIHKNAKIRYLINKKWWWFEWKHSRTFRK